jgi:RND superfamily putative drug exporter
VLSRRQRRALGAAPLAETGGTGFWTRWAAIVSRRPNLVGATATLLVLIIAIPFLSMRLGSADSGSDPVNTTTRKAYDLLAQGFGPGSNGTLQLVAKVDGASDKAAFEQARAAAADAEGVVSVTPTTVLPAKDGNGGVALAQIVPEGSPQAESTTDLVELLRSETVPKATAGSGVTVLVGGETAIFEDFSTVLSEKLPFFIAVVVGLSFLLLMAVFRSLLIPLTAAAMNLLSAVAAYGVITAVFQKGWGDFLFGVDKTGPIEPFIPVMMFAIVFGLSMDYQVFLVSRMYEEWHRTGDNREAISRGLAATGRTITAAAAIMILVFGAFVLGGDRIIKLFGLGLASAVAIDALIVRSALVPAIMTLLGKRNWWLPGWLDRVLPRLNVEGDVEHGDEPRAPAAISGEPVPQAPGP